MPRSKSWVRIVEASVIAGRTRNGVYDAAGRGVVRTRREDGKPREFLVEDLERLRAARPTPTPASAA